MLKIFFQKMHLHHSPPERTWLSSIIGFLYVQHVIPKFATNFGFFPVFKFVIFKFFEQIIRMSSFRCVLMFDCVKNTRVSRGTRATLYAVCVSNYNDYWFKPPHPITVFDDYVFYRLRVRGSACGTGEARRYQTWTTVYYVYLCVGVWADEWEREGIKNPTLFECLRFVRRKLSSGLWGCMCVYMYNGRGKNSRNSVRPPTPVVRVVSDA